MSSIGVGEFLPQRQVSVGPGGIDRMIQLLGQIAQGIAPIQQQQTIQLFNWAAGTTQSETITIPEFRSLLVSITGGAINFYFSGTVNNVPDLQLGPSAIPYTVNFTAQTLNNIALAAPSTNTAPVLGTIILQDY